MIALLGQRFIKREVYSKTDVKVRMKRVKTGVVRCGPNGPQELTQLIDEEVLTKEYYRIRRADMRFIGRQLWKVMAKMMLVGARQGSEWSGLQARLVAAIG